jgi:hypothetical protein
MKMHLGKLSLGKTSRTKRRASGAVAGVMLIGLTGAGAIAWASGANAASASSSGSVSVSGSGSASISVRSSSTGNESSSASGSVTIVDGKVTVKRSTTGNGVVDIRIGGPVRSPNFPSLPSFPEWWSSSSSSSSSSSIEWTDDFGG